MRILDWFFGGRISAKVYDPRPDAMIERIQRYRTAGARNDGPHTLRGHQVDDLDYRLMGADNACADIAAGGRGGTQGQWFAIKKGSDLSRARIGNSHGSSDDGGKTFHNETGYLTVPRPEFQVPPQEVIWHLQRVDALKAEGVEQPERVRIMTEERAARPWETA